MSESVWGQRTIMFPSMHALRTGVSVAEASAIIGLLTEGATYRQLVEGYGWTFDRAEAWITSSLKTLLLKA